MVLPGKELALLLEEAAAAAGHRQRPEHAAEEQMVQEKDRDGERMASGGDNSAAITCWFYGAIHPDAHPGRLEKPMATCRHDAA